MESGTPLGQFLVHSSTSVRRSLTSFSTTMLQQCGKVSRIYHYRTIQHTRSIGYYAIEPFWGRSYPCNGKRDTSVSHSRYVHNKYVGNSLFVPALVWADLYQIKFPFLQPCLQQCGKASRIYHYIGTMHQSQHQQIYQLLCEIFWGRP